MHVARWLEGKTLGEIGLKDETKLDQPSTKRTKGIAGAVYEQYFNIPANSTRAADFPDAGIELKTSGLRVRRDEKIGQKERLSLTMMGDFDPAETWATSHLREKLDRLLIIYYGYREGEHLRSFRTLKVVRWSPSSEEEALLRRDFEAIQSVWSRGEELSERLTDVLTASTKGPRNSTTRAYALKPRFNFSIYEVSTRPAAASLAAYLRAPATFEDKAVARLRRHEGKSVAVLRAELGLPESRAKNAQATVIRAALGLRPRGKSAEFKRFGLDVKTAPISTKGAVWENMSFAAFDPFDLVGCEWHESDLLSDMRKVVMVPLIRPKRDSDRDDAVIGRAFLWKAPSHTLGAARRIWEGYRDNVMASRPEAYPRKSDGGPIFVNTHGKDRTDVVDAPGGIKVAKRSFWLHPDVVENAIAVADSGRFGQTAS